MRYAHLPLLLALASLSGCSFSVTGVFRNDTSEVAHIRLATPLGKTAEELTIPPHDVASTLVNNATVILMSCTGKPAARYIVPPPNSLRPYYDFSNRTFYFRITRDKILPVMPREGRKWSSS
jgi:hypothetical protein